MHLMTCPHCQTEVISPDSVSAPAFSLDVEDRIEALHMCPVCKEDFVVRYEPVVEQPTKSTTRFDTKF